MREALGQMQRELDLRWAMVVPNESLADQARREFTALSGGEIRSAGLAEVLSRADLAIASTGTVTMECAWFGVPAVALYKTSWGTYQVGKRVVKVRFLAMPNLLANEEIYPELIQDQATGAKIAETAVKLLRNPAQRQAIRAKLKNVADRLGPPGAARRAADAVLDLLGV
jgi:lipid-A-disaccharide synthase